MPYNTLGTGDIEAITRIVEDARDDIVLQIEAKEKAADTISADSPVGQVCKRCSELEDRYDDLHRRMDAVEQMIQILQADHGGNKRSKT